MHKIGTLARWIGAEEERCLAGVGMQPSICLQLSLGGAVATVHTACAAGKANGTIAHLPCNAQALTRCQSSSRRRCLVSCCSRLWRR